MRHRTSKAKTWTDLGTELALHPNLPRNTLPMLDLWSIDDTPFVDLTSDVACKWLTDAIKANPHTRRLVVAGGKTEAGRWTAILETHSDVSHWSSDYGQGHLLAQILLHLWEVQP